jgi:hypothetical protein
MAEVEVKVTATLSAMVTRADGTVEHLGVISVKELEPADEDDSEEVE